MLTALSHQLLPNLGRRGERSSCCETPSHPHRPRRAELPRSSWGGEFRAHNRPSPNRLGAVILRACLGQKTAFIWEFICEIHSLRLELFLEGESQEALRVRWFLGYEGRAASKSESPEVSPRIDSALSRCFHTVSSRRVFLIYLPI